MRSRPTIVVLRLGGIAWLLYSTDLGLISVTFFGDLLRTQRLI
jgi:hypothetical protein